MVDARKKKMELILPKSEAAAFFQKLGKALQHGETSDEDGLMDLQGSREVRISIADRGDALLVGIKAKFSKPDELLPPGDAPVAERAEGHAQGEPAGPAPGAGRPRYKSLKKRMRQTFRSLTASLAAGTAPQAEVLESFAADSRLMCDFPGLGDEYYPQYLALVDHLVVQVQAADPESLRRALDAARALDQMKKDCHARHK